VFVHVIQYIDRTYSTVQYIQHSTVPRKTSKYQSRPQRGSLSLPPMAKSPDAPSAPRRDRHEGRCSWCSWCACVSQLLVRGRACVGMYCVLDGGISAGVGGDAAAEKPLTSSGLTPPPGTPQSGCWTNDCWGNPLRASDRGPHSPPSGGKINKNKKFIMDLTEEDKTMGPAGEEWDLQTHFLGSQ